MTEKEEFDKEMNEKIEQLKSEVAIQQETRQRLGKSRTPSSS